MPLSIFSSISISFTARAFTEAGKQKYGTPSTIRTIPITVRKKDMNFESKKFAPECLRD